MVSVPIKPDLLRWAIAQSASSVEDLSRATRREAAVVERWLDGTASPTRGDVEKIAARLGRSPYFFFLPAPPEGLESPAWYRSALQGAPADETAELREVRAARQRQSFARWVGERSGSLTRPALPSPTGRATEDAQALQRVLDWDVNRDQIKATSKSAVFRELRLRLESAGIMVQLRAVGKDNCRGFSLPDAHMPLIVVNSSHTLATVRTFTLLHELAHVARGEARVCYERDEGEERRCNRFAATFLIPEDNLRLYIQKKKWSTFPVEDLDRIRLIANRYKASWLTVGIRLVELGLAQEAIVDVIRSSYDREWAAGRSGGGSSEPYTREARRIDEFGQTFTEILLQARATGTITEIDARKRLRVDGVELNEIARLATARAM